MHVFHVYLRVHGSSLVGRVSVSALSWIVKIPEELGRDLATHN